MNQIESHLLMMPNFVRSVLTPFCSLFLMEKIGVGLGGKFRRPCFWFWTPNSTTEVTLIKVDLWINAVFTTWITQMLMPWKKLVMDLSWQIKPDIANLGFLPKMKLKHWSAVSRQISIFRLGFFVPFNSAFLYPRVISRIFHCSQSSQWVHIRLQN